MKVDLLQLTRINKMEHQYPTNTIFLIYGVASFFYWGNSFNSLVVQSGIPIKKDINEQLLVSSGPHIFPEFNIIYSYCRK